MSCHDCLYCSCDCARPCTCARTCTHLFAPPLSAARKTKEGEGP